MNNEKLNKAIADVKKVHRELELVLKEIPNDVLSDFKEDIRKESEEFQDKLDKFSSLKQSFIAKYGESIIIALVIVIVLIALL